MPTLNFFPEYLTDRLRRSIPDRYDWYKSSKPWIEDFVEGTNWNRVSNVPIRLSNGASFKTLLSTSDDDNQDLENSVKLHKALRDLTPVQARDPRLWARLTHVEFWPYMRKRWPAEKHTDRKKAERYIETHYFVPRAEGRALLRNGVARLWWYAHLTYDSSREKNPYELTGVLLKNLDITQQVLERSMGRCPSVLIGFLQFLLENDHLLKGGDANRSKIRTLAKSLNLLGGVALLDCLTPSTLKAHLGNELAATSKETPAPSIA